MNYFKSLVLVIVCSLVVFQADAQRKKKDEFKLTNAVIIGMMDDQNERYSIEINLTELLTSRGIKALPSLNIIKLGEDSRVLASDSLQNSIKEKGFDTYMLVSVRGYDKRYKVSPSQPSFAEALEAGNLYKMYQMDVVSVSFEVKFYRNGTCVHTQIVKCGGVGDRESVVKKFRKKMKKLIDKKWS